jgi:putative ABC transport system ATP-binding protein
MIELHDASRDYQAGGETVHALRDVDLSIGAGEYAAIMGPSGSGKSTLLNVLGLLDRLSAGRYRLDGRDVTELSDTELSRLRAARIGFVFQSFHLVARLTCAQNVELPMVLAGVAPAERARRVAEALASYGLSDRARHRPDELSGGQRQRVAIARATVMRPALLMADEPTGNLDQTTGQEVLALLEALNAQGMTLLVVTHDPAIAARARRRIVLTDGRIIEDQRRDAHP